MHEEFVTCRTDSAGRYEIADELLIGCLPAVFQGLVTAAVAVEFKGLQRRLAQILIKDAGLAVCHHIDRTGHRECRDRYR